jgi:hypothetical protein
VIEPPEQLGAHLVEPALLAQFHPLKEALAAMGVAVWPIVELEADDGLVSAARIAAKGERVEQLCIWVERQGSDAVRPGESRDAGGSEGQGDP